MEELTTTIDQNLAACLDTAIANNASDVLLTVGLPPIIRVDGKVAGVPNTAPLTTELIEQMLQTIMRRPQQQHYISDREIDFSFGFKTVRFRVNAFYQRNQPAVALRLIPNKIPTLAEIGAPPILQRFTQISQGMVVITGPTGHGKSTTLASMVQMINENRSGHIITIEDPVEYVFNHGRSVVSQREVGNDTLSFARALRSALREDPNVVLVGEMRDLETIEAALTMAETGHLVLTTLHTNSAAYTPERIITSFPPHQQSQVRQQLANVLVGVVAQRLIPKVNKGRILAVEIMIATQAIRSAIREGKDHQLENIMATSAADGMILLDKVLAELVSKGEVSMDDALMWANDPKQMKTMLY